MDSDETSEQKPSLLEYITSMFAAQAHKTDGQTRKIEEKANDRGREFSPQHAQLAGP